MLQKKITIIHLICIVAFLFVPFFTAPQDMISVRVFGSPPFLKDLFGYVLCVCFFYLNFYFLVDRYFFSKKYFKYGVIIFICLMIIIILPNLVFHRQMQALQMQALQMMPMPPQFHNKFHYLINIEHNLLKFLFMFFLSLTLKNNLRYQQTILEKAEMELSFLKAQINPHFFFNSLNTIYSFSIEKSDKTPNAVLQLSDMMRYVIYEADKRHVTLQQEITYLENYIELQKSRLEETAYIVFNVTGNIYQKIAPLILMPFVENAIKYGIDANTKNNKIQITLMTNENKLIFIVQNKIANVNNNTHEKNKGIGLENTINRLDILYPSNYTLEIKNSSTMYMVELKINLQ